MESINDLIWNEEDIVVPQGIMIEFCLMTYSCVSSANAFSCGPPGGSVGDPPNFPPSAGSACKE